MPSLLDALIKVESGGIPGRAGPKTQYGQALGLTQMLPDTAREMAQKIGVPWRPDLLSSPTDEGAQYQRRLGEAYLNEGMERTGNTRDALRYYHGGPDRRLWGPKTDAYADKVLSLSQDQQPMPPQQDFYQQMLAHGPAQQPEPTGLAGILQQEPDYSAMSPMNGNGHDPLAPKPRAFDKGGNGWVIAGIIADALAGAFGGKGGFAPAYTAAQNDDRQMQAWREKVASDHQERMDTSNLMLQRQKALEDYKHAQGPDPTNAAKMLVERGLHPGTPEFQRELGRYMNRPIMIDGQAYGYGDSGERSVVRSGTDESGRRVVQYSDGSIDYAD